jgi:hypothetical protein
MWCKPCAGLEGKEVMMIKMEVEGKEGSVCCCWSIREDVSHHTQKAQISQKLSMIKKENKNIS